jgi:hypothetical protein
VTLTCAYGQSSLPPDTAEQAQSSKRAMASDIAALMTQLGHEQSIVVSLATHPGNHEP